LSAAPTQGFGSAGNLKSHGVAEPDSAAASSSATNSEWRGRLGFGSSSGSASIFATCAASAHSAGLDTQRQDDFGSNVPGFATAAQSLLPTSAATHAAAANPIATLSEAISGVAHVSSPTAVQMSDSTAARGASDPVASHTPAASVTVSEPIPTPDHNTPASTADQAAIDAASNPGATANSGAAPPQSSRAVSERASSAFEQSSDASQAAT